MPPIINGLLFGLIFIFIVGPAFFALIQTSIQQGFRKAIFLALGVSISDTAYVLIVLFGMAKFLQGEDFKFWMALFGAAVLIGYAVYSWFKKPQLVTQENDAESKYGRNILKGLLLNGLNPFIIVFWATWVSNIAVTYNYGFNQQVQFFVGMLIMILCLDVGKAFIAHRLKHLITLRFIHKMNRSIAVILLLFTVQMVYFLFQNYA